MSNYENHIGKIKPIIREKNESFKDYTKKAIGEVDIEPFFKNEIENDSNECFQFLDNLNLYEKLFFINNTWWKVIEREDWDDDGDIQKFTLNKEGTFNYIMRFYNGGTYLSEMMEEAIQKIDSKNERI